MIQIATLLPLFCQYSKSDPKGGAPTIYCGKPALNVKLAEVAKLHKDSKLKFDDLTDVHVFDWMLTDQQREQLTLWTNELLKSVSVSSKKRVSDADAKDHPSDKKKSKAMQSSSSKVMDADEVMGLFS